MSTFFSDYMRSRQTFWRTFWGTLEDNSSAQNKFGARLEYSKCSGRQRKTPAPLWVHSNNGCVTGKELEAAVQRGRQNRKSCSSEISSLSLPFRNVLSFLWRTSGNAKWTEETILSDRTLKLDSGAVEKTRKRVCAKATRTDRMANYKLVYLSAHLHSMFSAQRQSAFRAQILVSTRPTQKSAKWEQPICRR